jgi:hypothetical protein
MGRASGDRLAEEPSGLEATVSNALDVIPAAARTVIVLELSHRDPSLLEQLRKTREPTINQRDAVNELLAIAVIKSLGPEWVPNAHGLAVEQAACVFNDVWPREL